MPKGDRFKFVNVESPRSSLDFIFNGQVLRLEDGHDYPDIFDDNLGTWLSDHLNSLAVNEYATEVDQETGQLVSKLVGTRPRFMAQIFRPMEQQVPLRKAVGRGE